MPFFRDLYDEQIPEMGSDYEASSFHTKAMLHKSGRDGTVQDEGTENNDAYIMGSYVRNTDLQLRNSYNHEISRSGIDSATGNRKTNVRATNVTGKAGPAGGGFKYEGTKSRGDTLISIEEDADDYRANKQSTVNWSDDEAAADGRGKKVAEGDGKLIIQTDRATYMPVPQGHNLETSGSKR